MKEIQLELNVLFSNSPKPIQIEIKKEQWETTIYNILTIDEKAIITIKIKTT